VKAAPVVCFGDSLTEGWGVEPEEAYPAQLARLLGLPVVNAGWRGDRAVDATDRFEQQVLACGPRLVLLWFGANEAAQGDPVETALDGLDRFLARLRVRRIPALLVGAPYEPYGDGFHVGLEALAVRHGALVAWDPAPEVRRNADLRVDAEHPNAAGHLRLAQALAPLVRRALQG
jgi:acyl-CoA thioesterase I